jgi:hypothetical protein
MGSCLFKFPEYFKTKTPEELIDLRKTPYSFAYDGEGLTFYEVLARKPETLNMFQMAMMQQEQNLPTLGMFPFSSLEKEVKSEPDRAFVVDIGGGRGQSLLLIRKETSNGFGTSSKMILQDRPHVLDTIPQELLPGIEKMPYDFYTEQPIKSKSCSSAPPLKLNLIMDPKMPMSITFAASCTIIKMVFAKQFWQISPILWALLLVS